MQVKKFTKKDRYGNMMSFEFDIPQNNIPPMNMIPEYDHPGDPKGTDTVPAWLTPGEFVVNKEATDMYGPAIERMNNHGREIQDTKKASYFNTGDWVTGNLLDSLKLVESGGKHYDDEGELTKSKAGALGAYQWMPKSASDAGYGVKPFDITDETAQRNASLQYLKGIQKEYPNWSKEDVLMAYNWGPGNVAALKSGKLPPHVIPEEAKAYSNKVLSGVSKEPEVQTASSGWKWPSFISSAHAAGPNNNNIVPNPNTPTVKPEWTNQYQDPPLGPKVPDQIAGSDDSRMQAEIINEMYGNVPKINEPTLDTEGGVAQGISDTDNIDIDNIDTDSTLENFDDSTNISSKWVPGDVITYKLGEGASQIYKKDLRTGMYVDQHGNPMNLKVQNEFDIAQSGKWGETYDGANPFSNYENELGGKNVITIHNEIKNLEKKAQKEVDDKGAVSNETTLAITEKRGELTQNKKHEEKNIIKKDKEINSLEDDLKAKYEAAKKQALGSGIMEFPTFEKWSAKYESDKWKSIRAHQDNKNILQQVAEANKNNQNIGESNNTTVNKEKQNKKNSIVEKIVNETKGNDGPGSDQSGPNANSDDVKNKGEGASKKQKEKTESFFQEWFGDLFDKKELARMGVMYLGSRLMGYNHGGSLEFAAKGYLNRIDAKAASEDKYEKEMEKKFIGTYTPGSIQDWKESKDLSSLIPVGKPTTRTGTYETFYGRTKKGKYFQVKAEKVKVGDDEYWQTPDGKFIDGAKLNADPTYVKGTKENREAIKTFGKTYSDQISSLKSQFGKAGEDDDGQTIYKTNINAKTAGPKVIEWAIANNVSLDKMGGLIDLAMRDATNDVRQDGSKAESLIGYLNSLVIRERVGENLTYFMAGNITDRDPEEKQNPVDAKEFSKLQKNIAVVMRMNGFKGGDAALNNTFIGQAIQDWNALPADDRKQWDAKADDKTSNGFMEWVKNEITASVK